MHTRRFDMRSLIGAVAALGIAAMLAGPASAQQTAEARTGNIRKDCDRFTTQEKTEGVYLEAYCRVGDDSDDRAKTSINLSDDIGFDQDTGLHWDGSDFQSSCPSIGLQVWLYGVSLTAECETGTDSETGTVRTAYFKLALADHYRVNDEGKLEVK